MKQLYECVEPSIANQLTTLGIAECHLLVAVSGGVDSTVLLTALDRLSAAHRLQLSVVHLDHMYRDADAVADAEWVSAYCKRLGIAHYRYRRPINRMADAAKMGFEAMARQQRYQLFDALRIAIGADFIATAHHAGDVAESVLMHVLRGSGLDGLIGIRPLQGRRLRPLLDVDKAAIVDYATVHAIDYRHDVTNDDTQFYRNRIRHELLPLLARHYNPAIDKQLQSLSAIASQDVTYLNGVTETCYQQLMLDACHVDIRRYRQLHTALRRRFIRFVYQQLKGSVNNLTFSHIDGLDNWLMHGALYSKQQLLGLYWTLQRAAICHVGTVPVSSCTRDYKHVSVRLHGGVNHCNGLVITIDGERRVDAETLQLAYPRAYITAPFELRTRCAGDYIKLNGLDGHKKTLKKWFNDIKLPLAERECVRLLACGSEIIWAEGLRLSIYSELPNLLSDAYTIINIAVESATKL